MKRKRGRKPKKLPVAADVVVDPPLTVDSDVDEDNVKLDSVIQMLAREASTRRSGRNVALDEPVVNNKTAGGAAAKLARVVSSSRANGKSDRVVVQPDRIDDIRTKSCQQSPPRNKQELDAAQSVINEIMNMKEAMPFNSPVNPIALGIDDYFDIIDTPMDFGTIIRNLEKGLKYKTSEDVFKDVQHIWDNCCKYNKKGSYILELMQRVKNNFIKLWTAAGLYKEQHSVSNGHLPHNPELYSDSTIRHEEAMHACRVGSTVSSRACPCLHRNDLSCLNKMQYQPLSPCCNGTLKPHQIPYQCSCSLHPTQLDHGHHQQDLGPQHDRHMHLHSADLMNDNSCNQWSNKTSPNLIPSYQPSPSCCVVGHPQQRTCPHQSSSSQIPSAQLQTCTNARGIGQDTGDKNHQQHQLDSVHVQANQPSINCTPVHQFNQNTSRHLHSSRTEGGRKIGFAGNIDVRPSTGATMNCTKPQIGHSRPPLTDYSSFQEPDQINSSSEQTASMLNIERTHALQPEFYPSDRLNSTSDNDFSKKKTQGGGFAHCQEESSFMKNSEESEPDLNIYQKTSGLQSQPSPTTADCNMKSKKRRGRQPGQGPKFIEGERVSVTINEQGKPVGPEARTLVSFLGTLARNGYFLPLTYHDWRAVPSDYKENAWREVQLKFEIDPISKDSAMRSLGHAWKNWKCLLKTTHYYPHKTDQERLADRDERVPPDQWAALIALWNTEGVQERSARLRATRSHLKINHVAGSKSSARVRGEQRQLREVAKDKGTPQESNKQSDVLSETAGPDKSGCAEATKAGSEADAEVHDMKKKVTAMEQTCAQMASQMAAMMSMMSSMHRDTRDAPHKNVPNMLANTSGALDQSSGQLAPTSPAASSSFQVEFEDGVL